MTSPEPIAEEPWVRLAGAPDLETWNRQSEITWNQTGRQTEKLRFFQAAFDFLTDNAIAGDYHEYGCHRARTFRMALTEARRHSLSGMRFFAFDSFEGLPKVTSNPAHEVWTSGALRTPEAEFLRLIREHGIYTDHVVTVRGYYTDTLSEERQKHFVEDENPVALACIDCDLYESAVPVFRFLEPLLQEGSVLYVDDLFAGYRGSPVRGVARAFSEFRAQSRFRFVRHLDVGWWGRSYIAYLDDPDVPVNLE
ncbi:MAG: TylF/MycF/NovP-related O-methyltransferase [Myxococcota bacterium]